MRIILWSGGLDSTFLLHQEAMLNVNYTVIALTIVNDNASGDSQQKCEARARKELKKHLPKNIRYETIEIKHSLQNWTWQMPLWLSYSMPVIFEGDTLMMAYLSSDGADFWAKRKELEEAFKATIKIFGHDAEIKFPLEYKTKGDIIKGLKKLKLLKYCWTCGDPKKGKACGKCMKCISLKRWTEYPDKGTMT